MESIGTELVLNEASMHGPEVVLEPLLREAIDAQEADRMSAITMLAILRELVTRLDGEALGHDSRGHMLDLPATPPRAGNSETVEAVIREEVA
ncbi:DGAT2 [Symbiodinium natans]|uniref:DGAT2 protein n=1 Tax=Symbiodinium natans TaxID=878477 RepID=A0A812UQU2_9DINO|nr:DGAT2 [Symbiodinium natans]